MDFFALAAAMLPEDAVVAATPSKAGSGGDVWSGSGGAGGGGSTARRLATSDYRQSFASRLRRQFVRTGQDRVAPAGERLREAFAEFGLLGDASRGGGDQAERLRRALVDVGVVVPPDEAERVLRAYSGVPAMGATGDGGGGGGGGGDVEFQAARLLDDVDPQVCVLVVSRRAIV